MIDTGRRRFLRAPAAWWGARVVAFMEEEPSPSPKSWSGAGRRAQAVIARHPYAVDTVLAAAVAAATTPWLVQRTAGGPARWAFQAALILPLVWRRRAPVAVFSTLSAVALLQWIVSDKLPADASLLVALYAVAVHRSRRTAVAAAAVLELGVVLATLRPSPAEGWFRSLVFLSGLVAAALLLGSNIRARRAHLAMLTERAARLEHERDQQARIAADAERTRIAREMHDVLAHSLAVMISLADGAAAKLRAEPGRAAEAISQVADLGRQSLSDTRRLLGVLREDGAAGSTRPQPGIDQLDELIAGVRATGLQASLAVTGAPFEVAPGGSLAVYRIVQEACTNTLKHAAGARSVNVQLSYRAPEIQVDIRDDGIGDGDRTPVGARVQAVSGAPGGRDIRRASSPTASISSATASTGHGLAGMRERAAVYRGTVEAGPAADGGWRVSARLLVGAGATR